MTSFNSSIFDTALIVSTAISTILIGEGNFLAFNKFSGISWALIYRRQHYKNLVNRHYQLRARQRVLQKVIDTEPNQGKSCPEKFEYNNNADNLRHIKKDLFKVTASKPLIRVFLGPIHCLLHRWPLHAPYHESSLLVLLGKENKAQLTAYINPHHHSNSILNRVSLSLFSPSSLSVSSRT